MDINEIKITTFITPSQLLMNLYNIALHNNRNNSQYLLMGSLVYTIQLNHPHEDDL